MTEAIVRKPRPKHLDVARIRLPLPGIVSILHRASGAGLFLLLPGLLYLLDKSLSDPAEFSDLIANPLVLFVLLGLLWAYLHHFCAGIRFLFLDAQKGLELPTARKTAWAVLIVSLTLTVAIAAAIWVKL
jgi:succinate dehydrogenase / fumarate reductase cytochrome b subunit